MLANRLKILLAERDLTIKDTVEKTGISRNTLSNIVNNPFANISTENVDKLCNYLGILPATFYDYATWRFSFAFESDDEPSLSITMRSGNVVRSFSLLFHYDFMDSRDPHNNAKDDHEMITASNPNGFDKVFVDVYREELSPLFQHQIKAELIANAKKALQFYDDKKTVPCYFNYDYQGKVIMEAEL